MRVLGQFWGFLTGYVDDRVILDIMNYFVWPQERYPESLVSISSLKVSQEGGSLMGVLGWCWQFLTGDLEDRIIVDVMQDIVWPKGRYPEIFVFISLLKVCQALVVASWRYLEDFEDSWEDTWLAWSSSISWITLSDPKEDNLEVWCQYLY